MSFECSDADFVEDVPDDMSNEAFDQWMSIDNDLQTSDKLTEDDVRARILSARSTIDDDNNIVTLPRKKQMKLRRSSHHLIKK